MNNTDQISKELSNVLTTLLSGNNMYLLHHRMQERWGYQGLADKARESSMLALKNSLQVMERLLFLENQPASFRYDEIKLGYTCEEQLSYQYKFELDFSGLLRKAIALCIDKNDSVSRKLLDDIYQSNQKQIDWLETQFRKINKSGLRDFLSEQLESQFRRFDDLLYRKRTEACIPC
jgi:bacterioferritin